jgi:hypothetical protein
MASRLAPEDWQRVKEILDEVLDVPAEKRAAFIQVRCAGDDALRREIESLAAAVESGWSLMASGWSPETPPRR